MTTLEKQVVSLELAKKLKELGVLQESYFQWRQGGVLGGQRPQTSEILPTKRPPTFGAANEAHSFYSAFTVAELGEMLPQKVKPELEYCLVLKKNEVSYKGLYSSDICDTEADARAKCLIYLLENNLLTL